MKKTLGWLKIFTFLSIILSFSVACAPVKHFQKISIHNNHMEMVTTKVYLNRDKYVDVLTNDRSGDRSFKSLLIDNMNEFVDKYNITLEYGTDYSFDIDVKNVTIYDVIKNAGVIDVDVKASQRSSKISGEFRAQVDLVKHPDSINGVGEKIGDQIFHGVKVNQTTFNDVINFYLDTIAGQIKAINDQAKAFIDYAINFEGHSLTDVISEKDLKSQIVNINAIGDKPNPLLEGNSSFKIELKDKVEIVKNNK